jgi:hypothetical protein
VAEDIRAVVVGIPAAAVVANTTNRGGAPST